MERCPACGSSRIYPSRLRSVVERFRHLLTGKQPYRCHECGWRRWSRVLLRPPAAQRQTLPDELRAASHHDVSVRAADLDQLDPR